MLLENIKIKHKKKNPFLDLAGFASIGPFTSRDIDKEIYEDIAMEKAIDTEEFRNKLKKKLNNSLNHDS